MRPLPLPPPPPPPPKPLPESAELPCDCSSRGTACTHAVISLAYFLLITIATQAPVGSYPITSENHGDKVLSDLVAGW